MYKNFKISDSERKEILEQHKNMGYKTLLTESKLDTAIDKIGLTPEEIDALTSELIDLGKNNFKEKVTDIVSSDSSNDSSSELSEEDEMGDTEFKLRSALDKIIIRTSVLSGLGIVPAMMFVSGNAAFAAGITAFVMLILKDAAWYKKGGTYRSHHYDKSDEARKDWYNKSIGSRDFWK